MNDHDYSIMRFFAYAHLPERLQEVSKPFAELADKVACWGNPPRTTDRPPRNVGAETTVALRKLLEAKDAAVRATLALNDE